MKKILLLFICCILINGSICDARIARGTDQFTGGARFTSGMKGEDESTLRNLLFKKILVEKTEEYYIKADNYTYKEHVLANSAIEMKIDNFSTCILESQNYKNIGPMEGKFLAILTVKVPEEAILQLKEAKRVALRFTRNNGFQFVYVLPDDALEEWKQVIATKE